MNKAVFLDRDGVINVDKDYVFRKENLEFIPGSIEALKKLHEAGYILIIVTNQSGIGRGYYTEKQYLDFREEMHRQFRENKIVIDEEYYCKHAPEENCGCRKPKTKFFEEAIKKDNIDIGKSFMIGDKTSDILAGKKTGLKTMLVKTGKAGKDGKYQVDPDYRCENLSEAARIILEE